MLTKKRIRLYVISLLFIALVTGWVYVNLRSSFLKLMDTDFESVVSSALSVTPDSGAEIEKLVANVANTPGDTQVLFIPTDNTDGGKTPVGSETMLGFYKAYAAADFYKKGVESASYEEKYRAPDIIDIGGIPSVIIFAPVINDQGNLLGTAVFALDYSAVQDHLSLMMLLFGSATLLFVTVLAILLFSRDVTTAFSVSLLFIIVGVFVVYPMFESVRLSLVMEPDSGKYPWQEILFSGQYMDALWGSITLGVLTATASVAVGFLFAFMCARTNLKYKKFYAAMATLPVISPPFSLTLSIILLFGNNGLITRSVLGLTNFNIYGLWGLVAVQTICMFPIAFLTLVGVLHAIDSTLEEAALDLSASKMQVFMSVTFPLALPGVLSAWLLVFVNSLADFANPLILAGDFRVLSVEAYLEVTGMNRLGRGAALSLLLLLPTITAFFAQRFWVSRKSYVTVTGKPSGRILELTSPGIKAFLVFVMTSLSLFLVSLYGTILAGCFVKNWGIDYSFSTENIVEALTRGQDALIDTLTLAGAATPIAGLLAMVAALLIVRKRFPAKRFLEALIMAPFALPGTLLGISYVLAFNRPPILIVGTAAIIVINYVVRELPVGVEGGIASLQQIDPAIEEAATSLGADTQTVFRSIVLPLIRPAFISSLSYTFVRSMTAVSAVIFLISARWYHLTVLIYNFSENLRFGLASVLSTVLIIIVFAAFGIMRLLVRDSESLAKTIRN